MQPRVPMSESTPNYDPVAVILARMETKLDNALEVQRSHATTLQQHGTTLEAHGNRITRLEAETSPVAQQIDDIEKQLATFPSRASLVAAWGVAVAAIAAVITLVAILQ